MSVDTGRPSHRYTEQAHRILPMNHRDHAGLPLLLEAIQKIATSGLEPQRSAHLLQHSESNNDDEQRACPLKQRVPPRSRGGLHSKLPSS
jgi:hypothetical protein